MADIRFIVHKRLARWFEKNKRDLPWRHTSDIYRIWVSEVMLQQTQVKTVIGFYRRFISRFPTVLNLAKASRLDVLKVWEGLGYYGRARNLHRAARVIVSEYGGRIPRDRQTFRLLPGVGDYVAAAVMSIALGQAVPVVDGNVLRVYCRLTGIRDDIKLAKTKKAVFQELQRLLPPKNPGTFNEALMELGALVCLPRKPRCLCCPLVSACFAFQKKQTAELPFRSKKKPIPSYRVALAVIIKKGKMYVQQRSEKAHLAGLWEFPGGKLLPGEDPRTGLVRECREELGVTLKPISRLAEVKHGYSHFKVHLIVFVCRHRSGRIRPRQPFCWIKPTELDRFPFPAANHKFFPILKNYFPSSIENRLK